MLTVIIGSLLLTLKSSVAAPVSRNIQEEQTVSWQGEPNLRGTTSILTSCLITLSLCVWTALHLNVPKQDTSQFQIFWKRTKWLCLGLLAPELVVYAAFTQYNEAVVLTRKMNSIITKQASRLSRLVYSAFNNDHQILNGDSEPLSKWTMSHSFCAIMGGFAIDTGRPDPPFLPGSPRLTLSADGVLFLAKHEIGLITSIPTESITNRSKSDSIAKLLVCMQAMWMIFQCIGRLASHLPITLLETNTLGHVVCAVMLYAIWFSKPQDVNEPIALKGQSIRAWGALLAMCSSWDGQCGIDYEISRLVYYSPELKTQSIGPNHVPLDEESTHCSGRLSADIMENSRTSPFVTAGVVNGTSGERRNNPFFRTPAPVPSMQTHYLKSAKAIRSSRVVQYSNSLELGLSLPTCPDNSILILEGESLDAKGFGPKSFKSVCGPNRRSLFDPRSDIFDPRLRILRVDVPSVTRFELAIECLNRHPELLSVRNNSTKNEVDLKDLGMEARLILPEALDWNGEGFLHQLKSKRQLLLCLASSIFGGLHMLAWNSFFPSKYERILWRASATFIALCGVFAVIWFTVDNIFRLVSDDSISLRSICFPFYLNMAFLWESLLVILPLMYLVARIYLLVESLISLRDLPTAVYQTPDWTQLMPHF